jgi:hypothetical protein
VRCVEGCVACDLKGVRSELQNEEFVRKNV